MHSIMSEIVIFLGVVAMVSQASSLMSSLILIPCSMVFVLFMSKTHSYSGVMCYIFVMIFIGGLMVLLVSTASLIPQEQGVFLSKMLVFSVMVSVCLCIFLWSDFKSDAVSESSMMTFTLMDFLKSNTVSILILLMISLLVLSKMLLDFKGMSRVL